MKPNRCFENYPYRIIFTSITFQLTITIIGSLIIYNIGLIWLILYLIYIILLEIRLLKRSCTNCYYYGKRCFSGKGKICAILFKKGNIKSFIKDSISFKDIIPDILATAVPVVAGIVLLVTNFKLSLLTLVILLFLMTSIGNGLIRGSLACRFCKQRVTGCPAEQLFNKQEN